MNEKCGLFPSKVFGGNEIQFLFATNNIKRKQVVCLTKMDRAELFREIQEDEEMAQKIYYYEKMMPLVEERIMGKSLHPLGFSVACHLIVYDLAKGVDGFTGKPMQKVPLIGHPLLGIQKSDCRKLAEKMYGTEYANQMQRDY